MEHLMYFPYAIYSGLQAIKVSALIIILNLKGFKSLHFYTDSCNQFLKKNWNSSDIFTYAIILFIFGQFISWEASAEFFLEISEHFFFLEVGVVLEGGLDGVIDQELLVGVGLHAEVVVRGEGLVRVQESFELDDLSAGFL